MKSFTSKKRFRIYGALVGMFTLVLAVGITVSNLGLGSKALGGLASRSSNYSITLNSSNKITVAGDHVQKTARGSDVIFTYTDVASSTTGHTTLNTNGTLVNKTQITSISALTAIYTGSGVLKARLAYTTNTFSDYFELASGSRIETGSNPYYIELKAFGGSVNLLTAVYEFTCVSNPDAEVHDASGAYTITFLNNGSDSSSDIGSSDSGLKEQIDSGASYISSFSNGSKVYAGTNGLKFGSSKATGNLRINFDSSAVKNEITTIDVVSAQYGSDTGKFKLYVNESTSYTEITPSAGGSVSVNGTLSTLDIETTSKRAYLSGLTLNYGGQSEPGQPDNPTAYEVGFTATDANKDTYTTNSIFANENALSVVSNKSDGTSSSISSADYSYTITNNATGLTIDPTAKFPTAGTYTLTVTYSTYIPQEITLNVGEYVYMTDVAASMTTTTFNTADVLANNLANNLTATIEYSNGTTSSSITYSEFASNGIGMKLLTPKGITYDQTKAFGSAGTWTVKVYDLENEGMYYNISIVVNAIPVQSITLNESSYTLYTEGTLQLLATVNPTNATNSVVNWTSNNEAVATVSEDGLVTAVAVGGATITAAAADGSNVYGTCAITVIAKPQTVEESLTITLDSFTNASASYALYDWSEDTTDGTTISGKGEIYKNTSSTSMQFNLGKGSKTGALYNTVAIPGSITKIEAKTASGTNRSWNAYVSSTAYSYDSSLVAGDNAIEIGSDITVETTLTSLGTSTAGYSYFCLQENESSASYLEEVVITYSTASATPTTPVYPTSISLSGTSSIAIGSTSQLTVGYTPVETNVKNVIFSSSSESVATVSATGLVTGVSQGSATITATAEAENSSTVTATITITVTPIAVTSVSLDSNSASVKVGKTITLVATVYPTNATNKAISWASDSTGVATVSSSGVVTGIAAGSATITVTTNDGNKTATCVVTVTASSSSGEETFSITYSDLSTGSYPSSLTDYTASSGIAFQAYYCANFNSKMQFKASSGYIQNSEALELQSITINDRETNALTVYGSNTAGSFSTEISGTNDVFDLTGYSYFKIARTASGAAYCSSITITTGTPTPTDPTSIILNPTSCELSPSGTKDVAVSYVPSNANQNKDVTWTSSNTSVATVSSTGKITANSSATAGQTATITARLTNLTSIYATCNVTIVEQQKDDHTVLIYMCGADLESESGLATSDIQEILTVSGQPDDVNIVIETGGASSWSSTYGISSSKLERWHVENKQLVKDSSLSYTSMGLSSTLQSFIEYGLNNYPADRTGLIFWNHGGAMRGVCYDEKKSDDSLLTNEVSSAVSGALSNCGMSGQKLEWVGYDACLMQVQDIASINSDYFNYMVASEESEAGEGWDYDTWVDDLYAKKSSSTIFKAIVDGFIKDNGGVNSSSNDQTLSYLNLSYMPAYITAWNNMATQLGTKLTSSNKSSFNTLVKSVKYYADSDYTYYGIFDAKDFINKLAANSTFNPGSTYTNAVLTAFANLVEYSSCGKGAGNSNGLCMFWSVSSNCSKSTYYTSAMTKFTAWRSLVTTYGS